MCPNVKNLSILHCPHCGSTSFKLKAIDMSYDFGDKYVRTLGAICTTCSYTTEIEAESIIEGPPYLSICHERTEPKYVGWSNPYSNYDYDIECIHLEAEE
jgi:predicted nucleic-acid-binding Zn-ribbon protein